MVDTIGFAGSPIACEMHGAFYRTRKSDPSLPFGLPIPRVPVGLGIGDVSLEGTVGGVHTRSGVVISLQ
jgi:hypothetical protein